MRICAILVVSLLRATVCEGDEVFLDQPPDFHDARVSHERSSGSGVGQQRGDDFRPDEAILVETVTFWMTATWPNVPVDWSFNVHRTTTESRFGPYSPVYDFFFRMTGPAEVIDLGPWPTLEGSFRSIDLHLFEIRFENVGLPLEPAVIWKRIELGGGTEEMIPGMYWFSPEGHVPDYPNRRSYWATAGDGEINGEPAWKRSEPYRDFRDDWKPDERGGSYPQPLTGFAMRIEGRPVHVEDHTQITDFEILTGELISGDLNDLRESDGELFTAWSGFRDHYEHMAFEMLVRARTTIDDPREVGITVESFMRHHTSNQAVWLRNWSTDEFDFIDGHWILDVKTVRPYRDIPADDYVNEQGEIEILIVQSNDTNRFGMRFESNIDRVRVEVTPWGD